MPPQMVRVLILDPSAARRQRLQQLLASDGWLQVVAAAARAEEAVELAGRHRADVIVVGCRLRGTDSLAWIRHIMQARPTPIVVVAATAVDDRDVFELMEAGALAIAHEPDEPGDGVETPSSGLLQTIRLMAEVKVVRRWAPAAAPAVARPLPAPAAPVKASRRRIELVAIGASTGGPVVLKTLLSALPAGFPVPIVIVQHMASGFVQGLAEWLSASSAIRTQVATQATELKAGRAYLAPDGAHLRVGVASTLLLDFAPPENGHRPAVSCLFASAARHYGRHALGILLTGMGKDGAAELKLMKEAGAVTIAQDAASSVVHGMPGEAIRIGGATFVMSPEEMAATLPSLVTR